MQHLPIAACLATNTAMISLRRPFKMILATLVVATMQAKADTMSEALKANWEYVADTVMGGVSSGQAAAETVAGRDAVRLTGDVSLDNNGGFVQMAFDLRSDGEGRDLSAFTGIELDVIGNGEAYDLRLRTDQLTKPWQSFRTEFTAPEVWTTVQLPFSSFVPHRTEAEIDLTAIRRIGVLAIGREFRADVAVGGVRLYP